MRRRLAALGAASVLAGSVGLVACSSSGSDPGPTDASVTPSASTPASTTSTTSAARTTSPTTTPPPQGPVLHPYANISPLDLGRSNQAPQVVRYGSTVVVGNDRGALAVDAAGRRRWLLAAPASNQESTDATVVVDRNVSVVSWRTTLDVFPGRLAVRVVDTGTGRLLWKDDTAARAVTYAGVVYISRCQPVQKGRLGECTVVARDDRTGRTLWSTPEYAAAEVDNPSEESPGSTIAARLATAVPQPLLIASYPRGAGSLRETPHSATTGTVTGKPIEGYDARVGTAVLQTGARPSIENGCPQSLRAVSLVDGRTLWSRTLRTLRTTSDCVGLDVTAVGSGLVSPEGALTPLLLDPTTGRLVFHRPELSGRPTALVGNVLVLRRGELAETRTLAAVDRTTGKVLWRAAVDPDGDPVAGRATGRSRPTRLLVTDRGDGYDMVFVLDPTSGRVVGRASGQLNGVGDGWFATASANDPSRDAVSLFRLP